MIILGLLSTVLVSQSLFIRIYDEADLKNIDECLSCNYELMADIKLSDPWMPLGNVTIPFTGILKGNGRTIIFAEFTVPLNGDIGLFGATKNARITGLKIRSESLCAWLSNTRIASFGIIAGRDSHSNIQRCTIDICGNIGITIDTVAIGCLFGIANETYIEGINVKASLYISELSTLLFGGVIGSSSHLTIANSIMNIDINVIRGKRIYLGGIAGYASAIRVSETYVHGSITTYEIMAAEIIGGMIGTVFEGPALTKLELCMTSIRIVSIRSARSSLGGCVGTSTGMIDIRLSNVVLTIKSEGKYYYIGGAIGALYAFTMRIHTTFVNMSLEVSAKNSTASTAYVGGLLGDILALHAVINQSAAIVNVSLIADQLCLGGLVGRGTITEGLLNTSGALGEVTVKATSERNSIVGGIVGATDQTLILQCYFIGRISIISNTTLIVGAMVGALNGSTLCSSYALANISIKGSHVTSGGVEYSHNSNIKSCYVAVSTTAEASKFLALGGMLGVMYHNTPVEVAFVVETLAGVGPTTYGSIGGFVGSSEGQTGDSSVSWCYAWGTIYNKLHSATTIFLGGFVGVIHSIGKISSCIAYVNMSSPAAGVAAGLFARIALLETRAEGGIYFSIAYVAPSGGIERVPFVNKDGEGNIKASFCVKYPDTIGCIPSPLLIFCAVLAGFDFQSDFQYSFFLANGSIAFQILPVPLSGSTTDRPVMTTPDSSKAPHWSSMFWVVDEARLEGYPFLAAIFYEPYCWLYINCHGVGTSPVDAECKKGWESPSENTTQIIDNLHRCNIYIRGAEAGLSKPTDRDGTHRNN